MPAPILDWSAAAEAGSTQAGGKGWQLGRLAQLGVPVPEGFVIGASASVRGVGAHGGGLIRDETGRAPPNC